MKDDAARTTTAVTLLVDDADARRMVLSWPLVERQLAGTAMLLAWSRLSGVPIRELERRSAVLFAHALCLADRTVDPEASRVVQHVAAEQLRAAQRSRR